MLRLALTSAAACARFATLVAAQSQSTDVEIVGHVVEPAPLEPTEERIDQLQAPDGFEVAKFAEGLINPRMLAVADDGTVYVSQRSVGDTPPARALLADASNRVRADQLL